MKDGRLVRSSAPRVLLGEGGLWIFGPGAEACAVSGDSAALVQAILDLSDAPRTPEDLATHVLQQRGGTEEQRSVVVQAIELLARMGTLVPHADPTPPAPVAGPSGAHVVVAVTGAVGALWAPILVDRLLHASQGGHRVRVVMTRSAQRFIAPRSFEALTHEPVATSLWRGGRVREPAPHIELAHWADLVIVYPCTATTLARVAAGDCSELVSAVVTATKAPVLLAPSMNLAMLQAPAVANNLALVKRHGMFVAHPSQAVEVADAPAERSPRMGGGAPTANILRFAALLLERAVSDAPRLASRGEWDAEHARLASAANAAGGGQDLGADASLMEALAARAPQPCRVLELGTGTGELAREAARRGHRVVATDFSREAIEQAHAASTEPEIRGEVTWIVDDITDTALRGSFDVCIDRGCFGCIPSARRARYVGAVASLVQKGGVHLLKVLRAPPAELRAHAFTRDEMAALMAPHFELRALRESTMAFGAAAAGHRPAWLAEFSRR